ncbi:MAG: chemotaxis protein CheW [Chromatiaceae bacterium]|nr:chemotaxis protein CheW [Chromatiaceae bacterium]
MLIPMREGRMLLPNATVAEIIGYREPDPISHPVSWIQGQINWHQRRILVVDFERLLGRQVIGAGVRQRIAVCYGLNPEKGWPLLGLVAQGIPRLLRVNREVIDAARSSQPGKAPVRMTLWSGGEELLVPDIDYLQSQLPAA